MSLVDPREVLQELRWSVKRTKSLTLAPGLDVWLARHERGVIDSPSNLVICLRFGHRVQSRILPKEHVETRSRSQWFADCTWRLSPAGLDFWAANIRDLLKDPRAPKEGASP